jgi:hypothetical protein
VVYIVAFFLWFRYLESRSQKDQEERQKIEQKLEAFQKKAEIAAEQDRETRARFNKIRFYLLARISDYSRELDFWRDTARKIILSGGMGKQSAESFLKSVTTTLGTWGTLSAADDYAAIIEVARMMTGSGKDSPNEPPRVREAAPI